MPRTYDNQFPIDFHDIPAEVLARVASGQLVDSSWGNDTSPSFETPDGTLRLWVDHSDPEQRELGGKRFSISRNDDQGNATELASEDNVTTILTF